MVTFLTDSVGSLMARGGWVMWPLVGLSLLAVMLIFDRCWFWIRIHNPAARRHVAQVSHLLRAGNTAGARALAENSTSVYDRLVIKMLDGNATDAVAADAVETQRPRLERYMPTLSTIITAAPMLGILGTVSGIIASFNILSDQTAATDPREVSRGIAEALLTTAAGLIVALIVLFPYNAFRAQISRTLGRFESLIACSQSQTPEKAAAVLGESKAADADVTPPSHTDVG